MTTNFSNNDFVQETINAAKELIAYCDEQINMPVVIRTNCILAREDIFYSIGADEKGMAKVNVGYHAKPVMLTRETAERVAREFKAENGHGQIVFKIWGWKSYYRAKKQRALETIANMENLYEAMHA